MEKRKHLYLELEKLRNSKVLTYFTSNRDGMSTQIARDVLPIFARHLDRIGDVPKISLILYTDGGDLLAAWSLVNLIKSFCKDLEVIIPANCFSSGTLICLGASNIVMTKQAMLGPIDPSLNSPLNPQIPGFPDPAVKAPVSVEFVNAYIEMAQKDFGIKDEKYMSEILLNLSEKIHPLVLGQVYKSKSQIKMLAKKLLNPLKLGDEKEEAIIAFLCSQSGSHDYSIRRREAKDSLGLPIEKPDWHQYQIINDIYESISSDLELEIPFNPLTILSNNISSPQVTYTCKRGVIESLNYGSDQYITKGVLSIQNIPSSDGGSHQNLSDLKLFDGWKHYNFKE